MLLPEVSVESRTRDKATWVVAFRRDDGPTEYQLSRRAPCLPSARRGGCWSSVCSYCTVIFNPVLLREIDMQVQLGRKREQKRCNIG